MWPVSAEIPGLPRRPWAQILHGKGLPPERVSHSQSLTVPLFLALRAVDEALSLSESERVETQRLLQALPGDLR